MNHLSDQELIAHYVKTGSNHCFAQIYTRYRQEVYRKCLSFTGNMADSEDFTQEIFIRVAVKLKNFRHNAKFATWLHTITVNYCKDQYRGKMKAKAIQYNYLLDSTHTDIWSTITDETYFQACEQAINLLPQKKRELLMIKHKAGLPINEIALNHDLTPSAVKMQLKRARKNARDLYNNLLSQME